ncbi:hypothetical protein AJ80_01128 [Polytolypa hystricis UAMH7299]|uniref:Membrane insertase YidC/Oxa/ALB C-terminal domain-containing protein n=1 Tax=Polytolypa hystricis (strain UAMH7299) TaxID=1447883 RepID=A0A2B7Z1G6_POLH7|nr:hypothetical protein AJ80_01128 [Polytolypa hystricis UAMH7299]
MLAGTGLRSWSASAAAARQRLPIQLRSSTRQLSTFTASRNVNIRFRPGVGNAPASSRYSLRNATPRHPSSLTFARFNSTAPAAAAAVTQTGAPVVPEDLAAANASQPVDSMFPSEFDSVVVDLSKIPEKIGYLKELGLDYGWGPTTMAQEFLEAIHIYSGLPWVASAVVAAVIVRVVLLKFVIGAADAGARLKEARPKLDAMRQRMFQANSQGDKMGVMQTKQEMSVLKSEYGIKTWKTFLPMLNIPISYGFFRIMGGMAALPVPSLENESFLWITDLTLADPFFLLPIATGLMIHYTVKRGGEAGTAQIKGAFGTLMLYVLPGISMVFTSFLPSFQQCYFFSTAVLSLIQAYFISHPAVRHSLKIYSPPPKPVTTGGPFPTGPLRVIDAIQNPNALINQANHATNAIQPGGQKVSIIDRTLTKIQTKRKDFFKDMQESVDKMQGKGGPELNKDGTPKAPPRLSEKERDDARAYEMRRREEIELERQMRNDRNRANARKPRRR